ncbi:MAG: DivIVA domain-containing protein [Acidimicrobiales bacterium]|nr:DivIVA domain-containing protein [Acidimicrobiales bacterium]
MDVTPQLLKDVDFREKKFGGYDPDEVDDFLERVGVAIGQLQMRLREMTQRAEAAEARLAEQPAAVAAAPPGEVDDTLRRTLLLAQRTADAAVAEAKEEAERIVGAARDEAERHRADDAERHERELQESQEEIRRAGDESRNRILAEVDELESIRDQLMTDVEVLERHVDDERARLQTTVDTLQGLLDAAGAMAPLEPPVVQAVVPAREPEPNYDEPGAAPEVVAEAAFEEAGYEPVGDLAAPAAPGAEQPPAEAAPAFEPLPPAPAFGEPPAEAAAAPQEPTPWGWDRPADDVFAPERAAGGGDELFAQPPPPPPPPAEEAGFGGLGAPAAAPADDPWADLPGAGPATQAMDALGEDAGSDNPWMADLARDEAANQPAPPVPEGDDADAMAEWYRQQEEAGGKPEKQRRFGRKK